MPVFKAYFKVIKQNMVGTMIYFTVFLVISILSSVAIPKATLDRNFEDISMKVAYINQDESTVLTQAIEELLQANNEIVVVDETEEAIKEALFFRSIDYAVLIPSGFTESFINGNPLVIHSYRVPDSYTSVYLDMNVNRFLNDLKMYEQFSSNELEQNITTTLLNINRDTKVILETNDVVVQTSGFDYYVHYSSYIIVSAILFCVTTFMILFNQSLIRQRTDCSPIKPLHVEWQIIIANVLLGIITVGVLVVIALVLYRGDALTTKAMLYYVLMFVYCLMSIALAFLISNFTNEKSILSAVVTTLSLVFAFLGGTFVQLSMLGERVRIIGSFVPAYWFSIASDSLANTVDYSFQNLIPYFQSLGIIVLFAIAFLAIGLWLRNSRKLKYAS